MSTCETCRWWQFLGGTMGLCKRGPPQQLVVRDVIVVHWPDTGAAEPACGEHQERPPDVGYKPPPPYPAG